MSFRTGGQILVDQLKIHGTSHVFCVPGESYLAVLDALHDVDIKTIVCRQEGGAAYMADRRPVVLEQDGATWTIDFDMMTQVNDTTGTTRKIRRIVVVSNRVTMD